MTNQQLPSVAIHPLLAEDVIYGRKRGHKRRVSSAGSGSGGCWSRQVMEPSSWCLVRRTICYYLLLCHWHVLNFDSVFGRLHRTSELLYYSPRSSQFVDRLLDWLNSTHKGPSTVPRSDQSATSAAQKILIFMYKTWCEFGNWCLMLHFYWFPLCRWLDWVTKRNLQNKMLSGKCNI